MRGRKLNFRRAGIWRVISELRAYPSAVFGMFIIAMLLALAVFSIFAIPYGEAKRLWGAGPGVWEKTPQYARPAWFNWFPGVNLPRTIIVNSDSEGAVKDAADPGDGGRIIHIELPFTFDYNFFPGEVSIFFSARYAHVRPWCRVVWHMPDGREIEVGEESIERGARWRLSRMAGLRERLAPGGAGDVHAGLFAVPGSEPPGVMKGEYRLVVTGELFEEDAEFDAELVVYGRVYGAAGTDHRRRSLAVALMWGTPIALAFAFLAAVGSTLTTMFIAAAGVWFGGLVDAAIQRITEVNMILPVLPIMIMVGTLYSRSIWVMLAVVIILGIFSAGIKTYRAIFLQVRESPYIEAAEAYGAGNMRILTRYMIPRVLPVLVPQFVVLIPSFVFLEATLAILGLGDPYLPTWGKVLEDAYRENALIEGHYYWVILPALLLILAGFGFAMVGFALDRIFNPRLRNR